MVLLSFDTEEFDLPREHGVNISIERAMEVSIEGTTRILNILDNRLNSMGVNYLLNVGPDGLGRIPSFSLDILRRAREIEEENA